MLGKLLYELTLKSQSHYHFLQIINQNSEGLLQQGSTGSIYVWDLCGQGYQT